MLLIGTKSVAGEEGEKKYGNKCTGTADKGRAEQVEDSFSSCVSARFLIQRICVISTSNNDDTGSLAGYSR